MAKALGLIGNFKGKLGNTVGYSLKDSNNKQTQGVRVYQPVVRNPKTAAQAEQRAKLAPINATYRALKMVIDRGQEGKAYGNKSRLAWLSDTMKAFNGGWFEKGAAINMPALVPVSKGSISQDFPVQSANNSLALYFEETPQTKPTTIGAFANEILKAYPALQDGDQLTAVVVTISASGFLAVVESIVLDKTSTEAIPSWINIDEDEVMVLSSVSPAVAGTFIVSREGANGTHLRNTTSLMQMAGYDTTKLGNAAKQAAIESYMAQGANTDWAEESLM